MHTRPVHTRLALLALVVVLVAVAVGVLAFRRASAQADTVGQTAALVAVGLDDQALVVALQNERWQQLRDGEVDAARGATDALLAVRDFDVETVGSVEAARSADIKGGYDAAVNRLLDRSGHVDPALLDGADAARAAVNADLLHWRKALVVELESTLGGGSVEQLDEARAATGDWSTTLRLSAAPGQADAVETATGTDTLAGFRSTVDGAGPGQRADAATAVWNQSHASTAAIVADADSIIWSNLVATRDAARRQAQLVPVLIAVGALVALLGLFWVGRRWPTSVVDPAEVGLETLVSTEPDQPEPMEAEPDQPKTEEAVDDEVFDDDGPDGDEPPTREVSDPAPQDEPIFATAVVVDDDQTTSEPFTEIFSDSSPDETITEGGFDGVVAAAVAQSLRPVDVSVDTIDAGAVAPTMATDLVETVTTLIDSALAHATPDVPVTVIGSTHDLGYLVWVIDDGDRIDDDRRDHLNRALGGDLDGDDRSTLMRRLAAAGERAGEVGIDIEVFTDHEGGNIARLFVPARHLIEISATPDPVPETLADGPEFTFAATKRADPLASDTSERLSERLARRAAMTDPVVTPPTADRIEVELPVHRPAPVRRPREQTVVGSWPAADLGPVPLTDGVAAEDLPDAERRAAVARRLVEQYRGGVTAAQMDAADDIVLVPRTEDRS